MKTKVVNIMSDSLLKFEKAVDSKVDNYCNELGYEIKYVSPVQTIINEGRFQLMIQTIVFQKK